MKRYLWITAICLLLSAYTHKAEAAYALADVRALEIVGQPYVGVYGSPTKAEAIRDTKRLCHAAFKLYKKPIFTNKNNCRIVFSGEHRTPGYLAIVQGEHALFFANWDQDRGKAIQKVSADCQKAGKKCMEIVDSFRDDPHKISRAKHRKQKWRSVVAVFGQPPLSRGVSFCFFTGFFRHTCIFCVSRDNRDIKSILFRVRKLCPSPKK